jgi:transposase
VIGIDIGKNSFHVVGLDRRGAIVLHQKWSRGQVQTRLANLPPCLIGMEACVGARHLSRKLTSLGHDARLMPAKYVRPHSRGQKNDFRDAEAIAEAVQRPTMKFHRNQSCYVATCQSSRKWSQFEQPAAIVWPRRGCALRLRYRGGGRRRRDSAEATPIRSCLISNAGHISVGLANWFDGLVCIAVTERKSAF